jgi:hypothetical protein
MHRWLLLLVPAVVGCGSSPATNALCAACLSDADCGGNPCFADRSGRRYCGRPCDSGCPAGFFCAPVTGTSSGVVQTCFPTGELCSPSIGPGPYPNPNPNLDAGITPPWGLPDLSVPVGPNPTPDMAGQPPRDLAMVPCTKPIGGSVTTSGGTVDRLFFGYTGDTRPMSSTSSYPSQLQSVINNIYMQMGQLGVEFALDGGDHMEASSPSEAQGNMDSYSSAAALLGKPLFMTMGNHECSTSFNSTDCTYSGAASSDYKMSAFMSALQTVSGQTSPYYRVDVMTQSGKAVFLVVADDAWDSTQQSWLTTQLTDADANAKYTFVSKHHPDGNTDQPYFQQIYDLVTSHKYTLFLTGHSHEYKQQSGNPRSIVMGLGGAPWDNPNQMWWGYLTVTQCPNDYVEVDVYDQSTGNPRFSYRLPPQ